MHSATQFMKNHCIRCHGPKQQEANLRLDAIQNEFSDLAHASVWSEVMDRLNAGEMPPEDELRPDAGLQNQFATWIANQLTAAAAKKKSTGGEVVMRRMNRRQYNNTIRDLVGVAFHPAEDFPEDPPAFGFDHIGSALSLSPVHIEKYLAAAQMIVDHAIVDGPKPVAMKWHFEVDQAVNDPHHWLSRHNIRGKPIPYARLKTGSLTKRDGFVVLRHSNHFDKRILLTNFRVHRPGRYIIRVQAAGVVPSRKSVVESAVRFCQKRYEDSLVKTEDEARKKRLRQNWPTKKRAIKERFENDQIFDYGPPRLKLLLNQTKTLGVVDVAATPTDPKVYEFSVHLESTQCELRVTNDYHIPMKMDNFTFLKNDEFLRPELLIDWIKIQGPIHETWPPTSTTRILGPPRKKVDEERIAKAALIRFMQRAFRRPVRRHEFDQVYALYRSARENNATMKEAFRIPLVVVLTSPHFLFLVEQIPDPANGNRLSAYEVASRLSYLLWESMPDQTLFDLAKNGTLLSPEVLQQQVDRMLADPKSDAFTSSFPRQWLGLREIGAVIPDNRLFPEFDNHLLKSIITESEAFFSEILKNDLSMLNFLRSDFTVVNERIARFYGIPNVRGDHFRRVELTPSFHRGGLVTQASIHLATSNGTRTSPVKRGVWILENLLGSPPPPPPPNAGDIPPGVPGIGKATVRVRLEAHRKNQACAGCHAKIDPLGFALENYNAIGQWRDRESSTANPQDKDPPIDNLGQLPDGRTFRGVHELQDVLMEDRDRFLRCFVEKLVTFALGRGIEYSDRPFIDELCKKLPEHNFTIRQLIKDLVVSEAFLSH